LLALGSVILGCSLIGHDPLDAYSVPLLVALGATLFLLFLDAYRRRGVWEPKILLLGVLAFALAAALNAIPEFTTGDHVSAIVYHSFFSMVFLLVLAVPVAGAGLYELLGATPRAEDVAHYPLVLLPIVLVAAVYASLIGQLVILGLPHLTWDFISTPFIYHLWPVHVTINGWPFWQLKQIYQVGMLYHLEGTGLLMLLTTVFSLPVGVGAGVFLSEFSDGWLGQVARFSVTILRAISLLILGLFASTLARGFLNTPLGDILAGTYFNGHDTLQSLGGSYITASLALSLLVIPLIARCTEEGCRSLPPELREGSHALGADEGTTLRRLVLPWALPNIVTGVLLGCAEAAGSLEVILFIAGHGDYGVGLTRQVTSLAYLVFDAFASQDLIFQGSMSYFQYTAGLLLLAITLTLGLLALGARHWLRRRYRGE
jgi:phosphate transport system permease protein